MGTIRETIKQLTPPAGMALYKALRQWSCMRTARAALPQFDKLHLGSAWHAFPGWANIDYNTHPGVIRFDLSYRLPIPEESIRFIFQEHVIEHLPLDTAEKMLRECYRVLAKRGVMRIGTPCCKETARVYLSREIPPMDDWHPATPCKYINEQMREWGHTFLYDFEELRSSLAKVGFTDVYTVPWHESSFPELQNLEKRPNRNDLIIEAIK